MQNRSEEVVVEDLERFQYCTCWKLHFFATSLLSNDSETGEAFKHIFQSKKKPWL